MGILKEVGGVLGGLAAIPATLIQNAQQKKMQQREFDYNTEMWNNANHYNSPEMQMARLKDAGLNPNLVYGNGSVTGNTSTQTPKYQAPQIQRLPLEQANPLQILGQFLDLRTRSAQANQAEASADKERSEANWIDTQRALSVLAQRMGNRKMQNELGVITDYSYDRNKQSIYTNLQQTGENLHLKNYQAQVKEREQSNALQRVQLEFYNQIPKKWQFLLPLLKGLLPIR